MPALEELKVKVKALKLVKSLVKSTNTKNFQSKIKEVSAVQKVHGDVLGKRLVGSLLKFENLLVESKKEKICSAKTSLIEKISASLELHLKKINTIKETPKKGSKSKKGGVVSSYNTQADTFDLFRGGYLNENEFAELVL